MEEVFRLSYVHVQNLYNANSQTMSYKVLLTTTAKKMLAEISGLRVRAQIIHRVEGCPKTRKNRANH